MKNEYGDREVARCARGYGVERSLLPDATETRGFDSITLDAAETDFGRVGEAGDVGGEDAREILSEEDEAGAEGGLDVGDSKSSMLSAQQQRIMRVGRVKESTERT